MKMGVVADDITGANDIGIMFAKAGLLTHVYAYEKPGDFALVGDPDIVILDTNSRLDLPPVAYDKVHAATRDLMAAGCRQFHNKTCSVFRGNIGVEFDAMLDALDLDFAVVVLGFPKNGRRTVEGIHYVHGKRLEESEFLNDPIHPMTRSDLVGILGAQTQRAVGLIDYTVVARGAADLRAEIEHRRGQQNYVIVDVVDQGALAVIARAVADLPVLCGSSALAEELPAAWGLMHRAPERLDLPRREKIGLLVAAGSLMPQTEVQVKHLRDRGVPTFVLDTGAIWDGDSRANEIERVVAGAAASLLSGDDAVVQTPSVPALVEATRLEGDRRGLSRPQTARLVSEALSEIVARVMAMTGQNRLVVAGGETSAAVCARLGVRGLRVWKEIQPGLPSCVSLTPDPLLLVLKSGSFGDATFLEQALDHLRRE